MAAFLIPFLTAVSTVAGLANARSAARAQAEGNAINSASGEIQNIQSRRRAARESRIRLARLRASSRASGVSGSSGLLGAQSSLGSNFGTAVANQTTGQLASQGLSAANQRVSDAQSRQKNLESFTDFASQGLKIFNGT